MITDLKHYLQKVQLISTVKADEILHKLDKQNTWRNFDYNGPENICVQDNPAIPYQVTDMDEEDLSISVDNAVDEYINSYLKDITWFTYWNGKTKFFWIRYPNGSDGMSTHADHVRNIFDGERRGIPTLTMLGSLNDDYSGGELVFWESEEIKLKKGECLIFPSLFLFPHKVKPVTQGNRYSFVAWIW